MKRVLIIGSKGLVGNNFFRLSQNKYVIDRIDKNNIDELELFINKKYDFLLYLANSKEYKSKIFTQDLLYVNIELFRKVLELSVGKIRNVIYFSTGSIYEYSTLPLNVSNPLNYNSTNPYVLSKLMSELLFQSFFKYFDASYIIRPFYIYGPNQNKNMLFNSLLYRIKNEIKIEIGSDGGMIFNPIHVYDVVDFLNKIIAKKEAGNIIYNFCGSNVFSLKELLFKMGDIINKKPKIYEDSRKLEYIVAECNKDFVNKISIERGLNTIINENKNKR